MILIPENDFYKMDGANRIVVPVGFRRKYGISEGDFLEYFTLVDDNGVCYMCVRKVDEAEVPQGKRRKRVT